ncbi:bifunctional diaminohydroxyphosphoribosylaminopyrimidine deaminase/5-amino-6-(5-phosphoribosylamino)uracil reductase RibD [Treponema pectinovorum]|uniref:bifunctional diaminohydroxyphosphoribosylaminopyrimidine deaminase/5-amino-6-(5-phosphoribosylamino)uracil reductase RibD n=1 Tax=Treponema pectinovorum TaxID=164 RepID=UPI003D8B921C
MTNEEFMHKAIELAKKGLGFTNPNPLVGAVIVKNGKIIAEGYHKKIGSLHAEREAFKNAKENNVDVKGATLFVTLEPCCHTGRQPPCTQAIIEEGIKEVFIGSRDPNPLVNGKGIKILQDAGIKVILDFLKEECDSINPVFFHYIKTKMPYVIVKYAMTADGQTATYKGNSKWITGTQARENVHKTRSNVMAIMTGIETVKKDNPLLTVRLDDKNEYKQPTRIILDSCLQIPLQSQLVQIAKQVPLIIFCDKNKVDAQILAKKDELEKLGAKIIQLENPTKEKHLPIKKILSAIAELGIDSILVESGGTLNASLFFDKRNLVQEVHIYIAPKIFGNDGKTIFSPVKNKGIEFPDECINLGKPEVSFFEDDILLKYTLKDCGDE